jgi:tetratricopeptide (TPR) repeat protein
VGFAFLILMDDWLMLIAVGIAWAVVGIYAVMLFKVIEPGGDAIGRILVPAGGSTPSIAQHSNIETMEMRGEYAKAAEAYRAVIESQPGDIVACEKLGQLAVRHLKDYPTAVWAYRHAEERTLEPRRKAGYAMLVAGIYRDNIQDAGKTIVEYRKLLERYPDLPNADRMRAELDEMKARHFEAT